MPTDWSLKNSSTTSGNVHRGMILGLLVGAARPDIPESLKAGLREASALEREIAVFAELATRNVAF